MTDTTASSGSRPDDAGTLAALAAVVLAAAAAAAYGNTLSNPFIFDDIFAISRNEQIRDLSNLPAVLTPVAESPAAGRPLVGLSFAINYAIGGYDVRGYHAVNIGLHLACGLLLFGIVRKALTSGRIGIQSDRDAVLTAFAIALLWTVHPLNSEVVDYLTERTESMMALCYLAVIDANIRAAGSVRPRFWIAMSVLASAAGMACKESMVTIPVTVALYDRVFLFDSWREAARRRWPLYAGLLATWVLLALLMLDRPRTLSAGFSTAVASPWVYLLNQAVIVPYYFRLALWPDALVVNYGWARPLTLADVWPGALLMVLLIVLTLWALVRHPKSGFLGAWIFITLAPASSVLPVA